MKWESNQKIRHRLEKETGTIVKDWGGKLPVALIYPNSYYIGMSNLGIQAIYRFINNYPEYVCERVFYEPGDEPLAMESQRPLTDFAILAFSVNYELDYFNVVQVLKSAGIPLFAKDRDETHPLVIGGGPCITANPAPLSPFFDCLCIGEAEALLPGMLPIIHQQSGEDRELLLKSLAGVPGLDVPGYTKTVGRLWLPDLDVFPVHSVVITHNTELGNMYLIEAQRGCRFGCRFCLVSCAFHPMRVHSLESIIHQAQEGLKYRRRIGLVGPAVTDHPQIEEIVAQLTGMGAEVSVSSLRIKPLPAIALGEIIKAGTSTVALAPEAGSQRLRNYIRKGITEDDIMQAVAKVATQGIKQLKLYFMIGLPTETDEDIVEMGRLVTECRQTLDGITPGIRLTLTIAPFVPKPGTEFQRSGMESLGVINHRLALLQACLKQQGINIKNDSVEWSEVQAVLSRGDESLAAVLSTMGKTTLAEWRRVTKNVGVDTEFFAHRTWNKKWILPWHMINLKS